MGKFDYKNYILQIKVEENLTDSRFVEFMKDWNFTIQDVFKFQDSIEPLRNTMAEKILHFFTSYDYIDISPDAYNSYEPINIPFNKDDIFAVEHCLVFPAGTLFLRKKRKFDVEIENSWHGFIFDPEKNHQVIPSRRKIGKYLGDIKFHISKKTRYTFEMFQRLIDDFCAYLQTDYGIIIDQETNEVLYQYKPAQ